MKVSFNQPYENVRDTNGYGYAAKMCKESLKNLGHEVAWRDSTADIEINFIQPDHWHWTGPYRIGYLPWESTKLRPHWIPLMNEVDEIWTPSPVIANWMREDGVTKDIRVYQHGVEPVWAKKERDPGRFYVLHHGAEALRKGGNDTIQAFIKTLWDEDATLILKMLLQRFNIHNSDHIIIEKTRLSIEELVAVYHRAHLMCYPSWGEGFGLAPLQAMATGIPVMVTRGWAPYEHLIPETGLIESTLVESPWQDHHPGKMFQPSFDDVCDKLRWHFDNREESLAHAYDLSDRVFEEYSWDKLTQEAFSHLL